MHLIAKDAWDIDLSDIAAIRKYHNGPPNQPDTGYQVHYKAGKTLWLDETTGAYVRDQWLQLGAPGGPQTVARVYVRATGSRTEPYIATIEKGVPDG